jgi:hypothetical protein
MFRRSYWNSNGKYQEELEEMQRASMNEYFHFSKEALKELNLYYDYYMNRKVYGNKYNEIVCKAKLNWSLYFKVKSATVPISEIFKLDWELAYEEYINDKLSDIIQDEYRRYKLESKNALMG